MTREVHSQLNWIFVSNRRSLSISYVTSVALLYYSNFSLPYLLIKTEKKTLMVIKNIIDFVRS